MSVLTPLARRASRLPTVARALLGAPRGRGGILLYHRVASPSVDEWGLSVSAEAFAAQMEVLASEFRPISLADLLAADPVPAGAVAVTFDDGYVDNLDSALPCLERHQVPATVYVVSGSVGRPGPFWWDEIERLLVQAPETRPDRLTIPLEGGERTLAVGTEGERRSALAETIQPGMRRCDPEGIERAMAAAREWAGHPEPSADAGRCVDERELGRLAASPLIEIGAHTHLHPSLRALDRDGAAAEIATSRSRLGELLGHPPAAFSYPFGDLRRSTARSVRDAGFDSAVATDWSVAYTPRADRFRLPREVVPDEGAEEFERRVAGLCA